MVAPIEWAGLRSWHPDVPDVVVTIASGSVGRRGVRLGHFGPDRWAHGGTARLPELFIGGADEPVDAGDEDVQASGADPDQKVTKSHNGYSLTCACEPVRRVRALQRTVDAGPILCGLCEHPSPSRPKMTPRHHITPLHVRPSGYR